MPYSRRRLVEEAQVAGFPDANERLVTEWVRLGLLGSPERTNCKGKRGAFYEWPDHQLDLFLTLLRKRGGEVRRTKALAAIPVGVWLYWGDEWVSISQVRRALITSTSLFGPPGSWGHAKANAKEVVRSLRSEGALPEATRALQECLTSGLYNTRLDPDQLRPLVAEVLACDPRTGGWGPFGWSLDDVVHWLRATVVAISRLSSVTDGDLVDARARLRGALLQYAVEWRQLTGLPVYGQSFEEPTVESLVSRSCKNLLLALGARMIADEEGLAMPPPPVMDWHHPPFDLIRLSART